MGKDHQTKAQETEQFVLFNMITEEAAETILDE